MAKLVFADMVNYDDILSQTENIILLRSCESSLEAV